MNNSTATRQTQYIVGISIFACCILATIVYALNGNKQREMTHNVFTVSIQKQENILIERGHVMSADSVTVRAGASGVIVNLSPGTVHVNKGDLLLEMDSSQPEEWYEDAIERVANLNSEKGQVAQLLEVVKIEEHNGKTIKEASLGLAKIKLELEEMGLSQRTRRLMNIDAQLLKIDFMESQELVKRQQNLLKKGLASQADLNSTLLAHSQKVAALQESELLQKLTLAGATEEVLTELRTQVEMQQFLVDKNGEKSAQRIHQLENQLKIIETKLAVEAKDMTISKAQIDGAKSYAPRSGICLVKGYYDWRNAGRWVENAVGMKRRLGDVIMEIINPDSMEVEVLISELDFDGIVLGQQVHIAFPALQGEEYAGEISYIGGMGQDRKDASSLGDDLGKTGVTVFNTKIKLHNPSKDLRPGMSAVVTFTPQTAAGNDQLIYIPWPYVRDTENSENSEISVQVLGNGRVEIRTLEGISVSTTYYKVLSGLNDGDRLLKWEASNE